jgi:hypothetical protein
MLYLRVIVIISGGLGERIIWLKFMDVSEVFVATQLREEE